MGIKFKKGNKQKKGKTRDFQPLKQEISIEDDPYWKISLLTVSEEHLGRFIKRFMEYERQQSLWVNDIMGGLPTYYCILSVNRGAPVDAIIQAFDRRIGFSCYPNEVIIRAFWTLQNYGLQKEYDDFLFVFEQISKMLPPTEKNELIETHNANVANGKKFANFEKIKEIYEDYFHLYLEGMPDIYEIAGLNRDWDIEAIKSECPNDSELFRKIYSTLTDPLTREKYDILIDFLHENMEKEFVLNRQKKKEVWGQLNKDMFNRIILLALNGPDLIEEYGKRAGKILNINQDWKQYIPPSNETFFTILGLDKDSIGVDKKELEKTLRDKYRETDRTPKVNLAYSVLKNKTLRDDYIWATENIELVDFIKTLFSERKIISRPQNLPSDLELFFK